MQDFILDDTRNLTIANGDFYVGNSDQQQQQNLLFWSEGTIKEHPIACVGAMRYLEAEDEGELLRKISVQFSGDGMHVKAVKVNDQGKILVNAPYE